MQFKRGRRLPPSAVADRMAWDSRCGKYRVLQSHYTVGENLARGRGYADTFYAMHQEAGQWCIITTHRTRAAATTSCERHEKAAS